MKSKQRGKNSLQVISNPEILGLTPFGMWILVNKHEYFVDFNRYPWFQKATMQELTSVEITGLGAGLFWPYLDIDVEIEALEFPERYPLIAKFENRYKKSTQKLKKIV